MNGCRTQSPGRSHRRRGQTMVEFATVLAMVLATLAILVVFLYTFKEYGGRILDLASYDYP